MYVPVIIDNGGPKLFLGCHEAIQFCVNHLFYLIPRDEFYVFLVQCICIYLVHVFIVIALIFQ